MEKVKVMISSTVSNLIAERDAVKQIFSQFNIVELIGADPLNDTSYSGSSRIVTLNMAKECDLYILILGNDFGYELPNGKSATEIEFDAAFNDDPTKILIFLKDSAQPVDPKQQDFIYRVCNYFHGYWRATFQYSHQLQNIVVNSFTTWLKDRAALGGGLNYMDHFVRLAIQRKPEPTAKVYYKVTEDYVEIEYVFFGKSHSIHFDKKEIYTDFWGCLNSLEDQFIRWLTQ